jgi:hypothetical protein
VAEEWANEKGYATCTRVFPFHLVQDGFEPSVNVTLNGKDGRGNPDAFHCAAAETLSATEAKHFLKEVYHHGEHPSWATVTFLEGALDVYRRLCL